MGELPAAGGDVQRMTCSGAKQGTLIAVCEARIDQSVDAPNTIGVAFGFSISNSISYAGIM